MEEKRRKTGTKIIGDVPWGTHICQFYRTKEDLLDILVPYFKAGLENNEFCMWITSEPLKVEDAKAALKKVVKNLDHFIKKGQIEILDYSEWYTKSGKFDANNVLQGWVEKENQALKRGHDGLRLSGNTFWLAKGDWRNFTDYEEEVNKVIAKYRMIAICNYSLDKCGASEVIDVVSNHQFALIRQKGEWAIIESSERKRADEALQEKTHELGERVKELNCLYAFSKLIERSDISLAEIFEGLVNIIPLGWQYPEVTCARLVFKNQIFKTPNFNETIWKQSSPFLVDKGSVGTLEVYYLEERPECDEGPFLKGERDLIDALASRLGKTIQRKRAEEEIRQYNDHLEKMIKERTAELIKTTGQLQGELAERKRGEEEIQTSLKEKEVLIQEIHHRVKNNLQVISSLLNMYSRRIHDQQAVDLFTEVRNTIHSMALIHSELYQSERFDQINMERYLQRLANSLVQTYTTKRKWITINISPSDVYLSVNQVIPCALVLNELISNAFKHAFREGQEGKIEVSIQRSADGIVFMRVKDDGIGFPEEIDIYRTDSLGLKLVTNMVVDQLKGSIQMKREKGTEFIIEFKILGGVKDG